MRNVVMVEGRALARFRADPAKVRVSIRRVDSTWRVSVTDRVTQVMVYFEHGDPEQATTYALERAHINPKIDGIDLGMDWAYDHPWKEV